MSSIISQQVPLCLVKDIGDVNMSWLAVQVC